LVTIRPSGETTKPEPVEGTRIWCGGRCDLSPGFFWPKNSSKSSSGPPFRLVLRSTLMLTTAGETFSARSANESGRPEASA